MLLNFEYAPELVFEKKKIVAFETLRNVYVYIISLFLRLKIRTTSNTCALP